MSLGNPGRAAFLRFVLGRSVAGLALMVGITAVAFSLTNLVPGDPALAALGDAAFDNPAAVEAFRERYRLDDPIPVQYATYLGNVVQGDLGESQRTRRPVAQDLAEFIPATIELAVVAITIAIVVGMALGTFAAARKDGIIDQVIRVFSLAGVSMPAFWLALLAFYWLSFRYQIFPGIGRLDPGVRAPPTVTGMFTVDAFIARDWDTFRNALSHTLLPGMVLAANAVGLLTRFTRSAVLEVLQEDFIRTAWAKGLRGRKVVGRHVLRAALVPVITLIGLMFGSVLSGTVLVEAIFAWPGVGQYAFLSANHLDVPAIAGVAMFVAVSYVLINIVVDLLYGSIDPRIRVQ
jgi:peptide/nickel transport system permease protein